MAIAITPAFSGDLGKQGNANNPRLGFPMPPAQEVGQINALPAVATALVLSKDCKTLYAGDANGTITIWDIATLRKVRELLGHKARVITMTLSSDEKYLVSGASDGAVIIWDVGRGLPMHQTKLEKGVLSVAISRDDRRVLAAAWDSANLVIDVVSGDVVSRFREPDATGGYRAVGFLDNGHGIAGRYPGKIVAWDLDTGKLLVSFSGQAEDTLKVDSTGHWLLATPNGYSLSVWSVDDIHKAVASGNAADVRGKPAIRFYDKLQMLAYLRIPFDHWSFGGRNNPGEFDPRETFVWSALLTDPTNAVAADIAVNGKTAVVSYRDRTIRVLDLSRTRRQSEWRVAQEFVTSLTASTIGQWLLSTDPNGDTDVWNPATGETKVHRSERSFSGLARPGVLLMQGGQVLGLSGGQSANHDTTYGSSSTYSLLLLDLRTGNAIKEVTAPQRLWCACADRTGELILAGFVSPGYKAPTGGGSNQQIYFSEPEPISALQIYNRDLKQIGDGFSGHLHAGVRAAAFSPKASLVASLGDDALVRVFDVKTRRQISPEKFPASDATDVAVTDDGVVVAVSGGGSLTSYKAMTGERLASVDEAHSKPIVHVTLSPNGQMVATMAQDNLIKLWSLPGLKPLGGFDGARADQYEGSVLFMDNDTVAAGGVGGVVHVWRTADVIDFHHWNAHASGTRPSSVAISADGNRIAIGDIAGVLYVIDANTNSELAALPAHAGGVRSVQFVGQTHQIISNGADGAKLWDVEKSPKSTPAQAGSPEISRLELPPDNKQKVLLSPDEGIFFDRAGPDEKFFPMYGIQNSVYLADRNWLVVGASGGIWIVDLMKRSLIWGYDVPGLTYSLAYDPKRQELLSTHDDGIVRRWRLPENH